MSLFNFEGLLDLQRVRWKREPQIRGCSSAGRAPALQAGGRQFDSVHLHHGAGKRPTADGQNTMGS